MPQSLSRDLGVSLPLLPHLYPLLQAPRCKTVQCTRTPLCWTYGPAAGTRVNPCITVLPLTSSSEMKKRATFISWDPDPGSGQDTFSPPFFVGPLTVVCVLFFLPAGLPSQLDWLIRTFLCLSPASSRSSILSQVRPGRPNPSCFHGFWGAKWHVLISKKEEEERNGTLLFLLIGRFLDS